MGSEFFVHFAHGLNPRICQIRPALDDDADKLRYIVTLARPPSYPGGSDGFLRIVAENISGRALAEPRLTLTKTPGGFHYCCC